MRSVLITGASRGIGKGIAQIFAKRGYNVAIGYLKSKNLALQVCKDLKDKFKVDAIAVQGDVMDYNDCKRIVEMTTQQFGKIDILINNAAQYNKNPKKEDRAKLALIKINSVEFLSELVKDVGIVSILNISSMYAADHKKSAFATAYQAGIESLTIHFANRYKGKIRVNALRPGACRTDMVFENYPPSAIKELLKSIPGGELIEPVEIGKVAFFLATNDLLTGQIITVDKGTTL